MKKIMMKVFMITLVLVSVNVFSSCKDHDEDDYNGLTIQVDKDYMTLKTLIENNYTTLQGLIADLQAAQEACKKNCETKFAELNALITELQNKDKELQNAINTNAANIADLQSAVDKLQKEVKDLQTEVAALQTTITTIQNQITEINNTLTQVKNDITVLAGKVDQNTQDIADLLRRVETNEGNIATLINTVNTLQSTVQDLESRVKALEDKFADYYTKTEVDELLKNVEDKLTERIVKIETELAETTQTAKDALALAQTNSTLINNLTNELHNNYYTKNETDQKLKDLKEQLEKEISDLKKDLEDADKVLQGEIDDIVAKFNDYYTKSEVDAKISALEQAYQAADKALQDQIDDLTDRVKANEDAIKDLNDKVKDLTDRVKNLEDALAAQITSIIPQCVTNPAFGVINTSADIKTNVLVAYYGKFDNPVVFPTVATGNNCKASQELTTADWAMIKNGLTQYKKNGGAVVIDESEGNAGTVYVTVNPGSVDFAGQTLSLVNSKDEESKITLTPLVKENNTELMFGYTRAAADNGFYSAKATLKASDIEAVKVDIEEGLKSAFTDAIKQHNSTSISTLVGKLYNQFSNILPAEALKATYTDAYGDHSIYSEYGIAATAFKPLSFGFGEEINYAHVPGYTKAYNLIDTLTDKVKAMIQKAVDKGIGQFNTMYSDMMAELEKLAVAEIDHIEGEVYYTVWFKQVWTDNGGKGTTTYWLGNDYNADGKWEIRYKTDANGATDYQNWEVATELDLESTTTWTDEHNGLIRVEHVKDASLFNYLAVADMSVNDLVDAIKKFVDQINDLLQDAGTYSAKIEDAIDTYTGKLQSYLDKADSKIVGLINSINERIQPVLVVANTTGTKLGSQAKSRPTTMNTANVVLYPTTFTNEVITPAFKKHVACVNVYKAGANAQAGDAACKSALESFNSASNVNTVIDGGPQRINVTLQQGYIYEIAYSALDYSGKISVQKYFVKY